MESIVAKLDAALYPAVCSVNTYLSNYILVFLLVAVGLWYSIKTRFIQVRCFGEGMRRVFGNLTLNGKKHDSGMSSFQALATAIAAQVGTGNIVGASGAILTSAPAPSSGCGSSPSSAWPPSTLKPHWPSRPGSRQQTAPSTAAPSITSPPRSRAASANSWRPCSQSPSFWLWASWAAWCSPTPSESASRPISASPPGSWAWRWSSSAASFSWAAFSGWLPLRKKSSPLWRQSSCWAVWSS